MSEGTRSRLTGWGRTTASTATVHRDLAAADVAVLVSAACRGGMLARGLGRSYGDAAQNADGHVLAPLDPDAPIELDRAGGTARLSAGTSVERALRTLLPQGFTLPVLPGTRFVTVGGAIAMDVHGKNHHRDGSFGHWVRELELLDGEGRVRVLSPSADPDAFWSTVGGLGLTGVICSAVVELTQVRSAFILARTRRLADLDAAMEAMTSSSARHHVAWIDASSEHALGRAVLDEGDYAADASLTYNPRRPTPAPCLPFNVVRPAAIRAANAVWWRQTPADRLAKVPYTAFFHPLDAFGHWHRMYGPAGLVQWQMVVPFAASALVEESLRRLLRAGLPPTLVVLKRMGPGSAAPLSFPMAGWTLAVDLPAGLPGLSRMLFELNDDLAEAGGRVYLAKDSVLDPVHLSTMYPRLPEWRAARDRLDPRGVFGSDLGRRLAIV